MNTTIEELQKIVADESRSTEERKQAAELILAMQGQAEISAEDKRTAERLAQFPGAQKRLATNLSLGNHAFDIIRGNSNAKAVAEKVAIMQIVRLMLDEDGVDGIIYAAMNWSSESKESLADRMKDHQSQHECNPSYRLGMQSVADQKAYLRRELGTMKIPYVDLPAEKRLEDAVYMTSKEFAEFAVDFHRKVLAWDLKQFIYDNLDMPGTQFFPAFIKLQRDADQREEFIYKHAYAANLRALELVSEEQAEDFLVTLADMRGRENLEADRRAQRIEQRKRLVNPEPPPLAQPEEQIEKVTITDHQVQSAMRYLDLQQQKIQAELDEMRKENGAA